jgi:hypothetical protein
VQVVTEERKMLETDCGTEFEIIMESKIRPRTEVQESLYVVDGKPIKLGYQESFINIRLKDGRVLKGERIVIFHEEIPEEPVVKPVGRVEDIPNRFGSW